ncbi:MAG: hypothetical protein LBI05_11670 [Planctomycetaceae bacterium]|nr:hypothetical protein [Planctomycetaceae bacterium]
MTQSSQNLPEIGNNSTPLSAGTSNEEYTPIVRLADGTQPVFRTQHWSTCSIVNTASCYNPYIRRTKGEFCPLGQALHVR